MSKVISRPYTSEGRAEHDRIFKKRGLGEDPTKLLGAWPGDETEEQLLAALKKHREPVAREGGSREK